MDGITFQSSDNFTHLLENLFFFRTQTDTTLFLLCQLIFALIVVVLIGISLAFDYFTGPTCSVCRNRLAVRIEDQ